MTALKLLDLLVKHGVLDAATADDLRKQVTDAKYAVGPEVIIDLLVENGLITPEKGRQFVDMAMSDQAVAPGGATKPAAKPKSPAPGAEQRMGAKPAAPSEQTTAGLYASGESAEGPARPSGKKPAPKPAAPAPAPADLGGVLDELEPMDLGGGADPFGAGLGGADAFGAPQPEPVPEKKGIAKKRAGAWDSSLMLLGGGGLLILIFLFVLLFFSLTRGSANEFLEQAAEAYRGSSYSQSIAIYEKFLKGFPEDPNVSFAKVRIGMAKLHAASDGANDQSAALRVAKEVLPAIETEAKFEEARAELATILPEIAEKFADAAKGAEKPEQKKQALAKAQEAMELVNNATYLPTTRRQGIQSRIDSIVERIRVAERAVNQDRALSEGVKAITEKTAAGDTAGAYAARDALLQDYPALEKYAEVVEAAKAISERERELVKGAEKTLAPSTEEVAGPALPRLVTARRSGKSIAAAAGQTHYALLSGAVYAIDAGEGKVKWRRYLGPESLIAPQSLANAGGDALVCDEARSSLMRLSSAAGKLVWRLDFGEKTHVPTIFADQIWVSVPSGVVRLVNVETGASLRSAQLPQGTTSPPAIDFKRKLVYQAGEHSTLFLLSTEGGANEPLAAKGVYHLGHRPGAITVAPAVVLGYLFVFENLGSDATLIHKFGPTEDNLGIQPVGAPIKTQGRIVLPAAVAGKRLTVATDLGEVRIFDVDPSNAESPISETAKMPAGLPEATFAYHALDGTKLWLADRRLADYEIQATRQAFERGKSSFEGDVFLNPLHVYSRTLIHARRRKGALGATLTGMNLANPAESWQLEIAAPQVAVFTLSEKKRFAAVTSNGDLFEVTAEDLKTGVRETTLFSPDATTGNMILQPPALMADGTYVFVDTLGKRWLSYRPEAANPVKLVLAKTRDAIACTPVACGPGAATPLAAGSIWLLDPATSNPVPNCAPYQPEVDPMIRVAWLPPAKIDDVSFAAIDAAQHKLHIVRYEAQPQKKLTGLRSLDLSFDAVGAPGVAGGTLYVAARKESTDEILSFKLPGLEPGEKWELGGRLRSGFDRAGDDLMLTTAAGELWRFGGGGKLLGKTPLAIGSLVGTPVAQSEGRLILAGAQGSLAALKPDGTLGTPQVTGETLGGPFSIFGTRALAAGSDGTLFLVPLKLDE